ncbi:MAG: SOS response-associated peptidase [Deltaproteobacteria bacterium]|nr:SOS response-associated peptidase [Deltaproteobacteria bacterium]
MCGRYTLTHDRASLSRRFSCEAGGLTLAPRYNLAPGQEGAVVVNQEGRRLRLMRWGLIPPWAKEAASGYKMINARAETVAAKPSFKGPLARRRCLVLADGFYEWPRQAGRKAKTPFRFVLAGEEPFALAGLWERWAGPEGRAILSYTIITTPANELIRSVHDRMPVILDPGDEEPWLDPALRDPATLTKLLRPFPARRMAGYPVSPAVNSTANDAPALILPVEG